MRFKKVLLFLILLLFIISPVSAACKSPIADFVANETTVCIGDVIQFNDTSDYFDGTPYAWWWLFGDSQDSHLQNATHSYDTVGTYNVSLWVQSECGQGYYNDTEVKVWYITVVNCYSADFVANRSCVIGVPAYIILNQSCGGPGIKTSWYIDAGIGFSIWNGTYWVTDADGLFDEDLNNDYNVFLNFTSYGTYTVTHSCDFPPPIGSLIETKTDYIIIGVNGTYCECDECCIAGATVYHNDHTIFIWVIAGILLIGTLFVWRKK